MKLKGAGNKSKLTWEKVNEIRKRYNNGRGENQNDLSKAFDITQATISNIVNFRIWKDVALNDHEARLTNQAHTIGALKSEITKLKKRVDQQDKLIEALQKKIDELERTQNVS